MAGRSAVGIATKSVRSTTLPSVRDPRTRNEPASDVTMLATSASPIAVMEMSLKGSSGTHPSQAVAGPSVCHPLVFVATTDTLPGKFMRRRVALLGTPIGPLSRTRRQGAGLGTMATAGQLPTRVQRDAGSGGNATSAMHTGATLATKTQRAALHRQTPVVPFISRPRSTIAAVARADKPKAGLAHTRESVSEIGSGCSSCSSDSVVGMRRQYEDSRACYTAVYKHRPRADRQ